MAVRTGIMLPYGFSEKRFRPGFVQPKLNGDRCRFLGGELLSSSGATRTSVPHLTEQLRYLGAKEFEFDGELYLHGMAHSGIRSIVSRTTNLHPEYSRMQYFIYDIADERPQYLRLMQLSSMSKGIFKMHPGLFVVPSIEITTLKEFYYWYAEFLDLGYEGIIWRDPSAPYLRKKVTTMLKHKPFTSDSFEIVGWEEEISIHGELKGALGALTMITLEGERFNTGTGFTRKQREDLWEIREELLGSFAKIRYESLSTSRGVPEKSCFEELA